MFEFFFGDFSWGQVAILAVSAVLIGINKTGLPGIGLLPVILLAEAFPAWSATGLQLVMLGTADIMAVLYYRRHADWGIVLRLLPWALGGIVLGSVTLRFVSDAGLRPLLAWIILFLVILGYVSKYVKSAEKLPGCWYFGAFFGVLAGFTTQVANAAGPVMALYLIAMKLDKTKYMGSAAWYFLILNWIKIPIFTWEGRITMQAVRVDLGMLPFLLFGGALGILVLRKLPQAVFIRIIEVLVVISALKMLIWG